MIRARHEGTPRTCVHCREPIVRLSADGSDSVSKWLHTPNRLHCLNRWREVLPTAAQPPAKPAPVVALPCERKASDGRQQGRWAA